MESMKKRTGKMEKQLKQWGMKLDDFVSRAEKAGTEVKADYRKNVDELKAKIKIAHSKLAELQAAGGESWVIFQAGVESTWNEIEVAFKKLSN
jgi:hypothetical protein